MTTFEKLIDGLRLYEVLLLACGSLLFIVLLVLLCIFVSQRRNPKQLLLFLSVAVLMLAWPSIQKLNIESLGASIQTKSAAYSITPSEEKKAELEQAIEQLQDKNVKDPKVVMDIAKAEFVIGKDQASLATLSSLPESEQNNAAVANLKKSITTANALKKQIKLVEAQPKDNQAVKKLTALQREAMVLPIQSPAIKKNIVLAEKKINYGNKISN